MKLQTLGVQPEYLRHFLLDGKGTSPRIGMMKVGEAVSPDEEPIEV